jgi:4-diphosphocytidyl-2C-methyl-D-erythritol kinase
MTDYKITSKNTNKSILLNTDEVVNFLKYNDLKNYTLKKQKTIRDITEDIIFYTASFLFMSVSLYALCFMFSTIDKLTL